MSIAWARTVPYLYSLLLPLTQAIALDETEP